MLQSEDIGSLGDYITRHVLHGLESLGIGNPSAAIVRIGT